ncbi:YggT family protein [Acetobacter sp.]|uniref:YggT family protein n=1 Tax=Acetobacter sp. TaxID=440 RepID=UPI0025B981D1|nr:YggT family protein [Acetobacter sp.]MCH4092445.1 YggT family protein [Acetobacter sp.]MCI1299579.1 YggT family protein [Acetobacter sp.]MCI1315541.1 YggT family protein [Acetobacter sp.]
MYDLWRLLLTVVKLYEAVIIIYCVFSMLYSFGVLDTRNRIVWQVGRFLGAVVEPVLTPLRNILPSFGNVDLSPLVVLLVLQYLVEPFMARQMMSSLMG